MPPLRITIVGAGVIGISSAYVISNEIQECKIKVVAEKFIPNNTGKNFWNNVIHSADGLNELSSMLI